MAPYQFDKKNSEDYEHNSLLIANAIREIRKNLELKPTIAQLHQLTGLHRNTLSSRPDVKHELQSIKELRKHSPVQEQSSHKDEARELRACIENAKTELVFWYTKVRELEKVVEQLSTNLDHMSKANSYHIEELDKMKKSRDQLSIKVDQLTDLLYLKNGVNE